MPNHRRRELLFSIAGLAVSGCSATPTLRMLGESLGLSGGRSGYPVTREQVEASPYAYIAARFDELPRAVMVLSRYDGDARHWLSANRAVLVTRYGRLVQTVGLQRDLKHASDPNNDPLRAGLHLLSSAAGPYSRTVDVTPGDYGVPVNMEYVREENEEIEILDRRHLTVRVREKVSVAVWKWRATNTYWVDSVTGFVWKSVQQYCPELAPLEIEVLKPPA